MVLELIALLCTELFAGAAVYVTLVEHPGASMRTCGRPGGVSAELSPRGRDASRTRHDRIAGRGGRLGARTGGPTLVAGLSLGAVIPFTLLMVLPTNKRLLDSKLDAHSTEAAALLAHWGRLHAVRTFAGVIAFVLLALDLAGRLWWGGRGRHGPAPPGPPLSVSSGTPWPPPRSSPRRTC